MLHLSHVSVVIGPGGAASRAKETLCGPGYGKVRAGAAGGRRVNGALCPHVSVVLGDVIDIDEPAGWCTTAGRVCQTTTRIATEERVLRQLAQRAEKMGMN